MSDNVIMVTGATGKIGRRLVDHFLGAGWRVVATGRSPERLANIPERTPGRLHRVAVDLAQPPAESMAELEAMGIIPTVLVNNARDVGNLALGADGCPSPEQWQREFHLAVVAPFQWSMALAGTDRLRAVVNVASIYGVVAPHLALYDEPARQSPIHYGVTKAAMIHLGKELAVRLAHRGVRVNTVSYGGVEGRVSDEFKERYGRLCPNGRMLGEDELAEAVAFLASDGARGITGHNLMVDGGWTAW